MDCDLDQDQKNNRDALEAIGVEYPIEKRYLITESQLRAVNDALDERVLTMTTRAEAKSIRKGEAATENLDPAGGCEHWHRKCHVCGVWPVLEGWISDDTYFCTPCGEARNTETYRDAAGVEHTGLTMGQCYDLIEKDHPDNDFFFWTQWPLEDDDCFSDSRNCECHCWLCTKYKAAHSIGYYGKEDGRDGRTRRARLVCRCSCL